MIDDIPEDGWPVMPVVAPYEFESIPTFETGLLDLSSEEAVDELLKFYTDTLVPQLACAPDGSATPHPQLGWLLSEEPPRTVVTSRADGQLVGAWIIKLNQIYYPCSTIDFVAPIFRSLWDESVEHFDYLWGETQNPVIMAFAQSAMHIPRRPTSPEVNVQRLEWRRP